MKTFIAICLVIICIIGFASICSAAFAQPEIVSYDKYIVQSGDTLWEIAQESNGWNKMDAYIIIDAIEEKSNCTALIHPGQVVYIPVYDLGK